MAPQAKSGTFVMGYEGRAPLQQLPIYYAKQPALILASQARSLETWGSNSADSCAAGLGTGLARNNARL